MSYTRIRNALQALYNSAMADKQEGSPGILALVEARDALKEPNISPALADAAWDAAEGTGQCMHDITLDAIDAILKVGLDAERPPIDIILHCPNCGMQHIDERKQCTMGVGCTEASACYANVHGCPEKCDAWDNPPHRSHLCHECGHIWRPADVCTNGVAHIETKGKNDSPVRTSEKTWCEYVAGILGTYLNEPVEGPRIFAMARIIQRRLWALPSATKQPKIGL